MSDTLMTGSTTSSDAPASTPSADTPASSDAKVDAGIPAAADPAAAAPEAETPEAKAAREAAETPEAKAEREAAEAKAAGAPETYEDFTMPEGVELDTELAGELQGIAKELNLPQAAAQKVADLGAKMILKMSQAAEEANTQAVADWTAATKADAEIGGSKLPATLASANKVLAKFASPELKTLLDQSGLGNNPELIRVFARIGAVLSEDTLDTGNGNAQPVRDAANKLYPDQK